MTRLEPWLDWLDEVSARHIMEAMSSGIIIIDADQRILYANSRMEVLFGYTPAELSGQTMGLLLPERLRERHAQHVTAYFCAPKQRPMGIGLNLVGLKKDGREFPIEVSLSYLTSPTLLAIATIEDITIRHRLEQELQQHNAELEAFAHTVAHDLKNPLALILGYIEYLQENLNTLPPVDIINALERIRQSSKKMHHIIDELLVLASARQEVELTPVAMLPIVHEVQQRLREALRQQDKTLILPETLPPARGHAPWIEEVWMNYLTNALKYGGTTIRIGATPIAPNRVRYWVWDSGPGLTPEQQARLFQEYQRLQRVEEGSGLGLSIVKRLVERMGGTVDVISAPGAGTSFGFTLETLPEADASPHESDCKAQDLA